MFGQTFELFDLLRVAFIAFLEIVLSADNAIILGLLVHKLPLEKRQKALTAGVVSSLLFRAIALFSLSFLLQFSWIQGLGAAYLLYLAIRHFFFPSALGPKGSETSFWKTVLLIEGYDFLFAIDSMVVAVAFINSIPGTGPINPKLWVVYFGVLIGLIAIRFAAKLFSTLIEKRPLLERAAYLMIAWIGLKMGLNSLFHDLGPWFDSLFWVGLALLFLFGMSQRKRS